MSKTPSHPCLLVGPEQIERLRSKPRRGLLKQAAETVAAQADRHLTAPLPDRDVTQHNAALLVARETQCRVVTLLVRWLATGDDRYRARVLEHVAEMAGWRYWSWIAWRRGDDAPDAIFDLSYGENSATLALAFDLLADTLDADEEALFVDQARGRALKAFLKHTDPKAPTWWVGCPNSNWNTVCAGGGGMLALAMRGRVEGTEECIRRAERSIKPFMQLLRSTDGGWPEGIGYWNYGMRYAWMYLLSHERATGRAHPLLEQPATAKTMRFPLDFCPNAVPCSFGDVNALRPSPVNYAALTRLGQTGLVDAYDRLLASSATQKKPPWAESAELLLFHPRASGQEKSQRNRVHVYPRLDWGLLADRWPSPNLYLSVRGGTTEVPHGHHDLLSFHAAASDERLVENVGPREYIDSTFGPQRYEMPEFRADGKNTILINGVGVHAPAKVKTSTLTVGRRPGIRMDATDAYGKHRDVPVAKFIGRLFLLLPGIGALIVDRVELRFAGPVESRMHTPADVKLSKASALLIGERQQMRIAWASDRPGELATATMATTTPGNEPTILRWFVPRSTNLNATTATLLSPGRGRASVAVRTEGRRITIEATCGDTTRRVRLSTRLRAIRSK